MKNLLLLISMPLFIMGQNIPLLDFGVKLETQYKITDVKTSDFGLNTNKYYETTNIPSVGLILGVNLEKVKIGGEFLFNLSNYRSINDEYVDAFAGNLVPVIDPSTGVQEVDPISGDLVFEKDGEHDAYTLTNSTEIKSDWQFNIYVSYSIITNLYISAIPYFRKYTANSIYQEWVRDVPVTTITGTGSPTIVYQDMVMSSATKAEWDEYGFSLGLSYKFSKFILDLRIPVVVKTSNEDAQANYQMQYVTDLEGFNTPKKKAVILSVAYMIF